MTMIRRRFFDLPDRQVHYREAEGAGRPLVLLHLMPGSAKQMEPLMTALSPQCCLAPDMAGTGDSDPLAASDPSIADYAGDTIAFLRALGGGVPVDLYGSHTGACLAVEVALLAPELVRSVILDGMPLFTPEKALELTQRYAPEVTPDHNGLHLLWAHNFCRDQILFYPWYDKSQAAARGNGLPPPEALHRWVLEVIKGLGGIPKAYRAAFTYPSAERLARLTHPTLCLAPRGDSLFEATQRAVSLIPHGRLVVLDGNEAGHDVSGPIREFLGQQA